MYNCNKCQRQFKTKKGLNIHKHGCLSNEEYDHKKCKFCGKEFKSKYSLAGHMTWCKNNPKIEETRLKCNTWGKKKHSQETKDKISKSRIKYLMEHPDKVPYLLNHSSRMSYPEKIFKNALIEMNITGGVQEYRNSIYSYDFAGPEYKIDVEIDGATHNTERVKIIDKRRDKFSRSEGGTVVRFTAKEIKENVVQCVNKVLSVRNSNG